MDAPQLHRFVLLVCLARTAPGIINQVGPQLDRSCSLSSTSHSLVHPQLQLPLGTCLPSLVCNAIVGSLVQQQLAHRLAVGWLLAPHGKVLRRKTRAQR